MLQREFASGNTQAAAAEDDAPRIGSVDPQGKLVTHGPKKRASVNALLVMLAAVTTGAGWYGALFIHLSTSSSTTATGSDSDKPPPQGTLAAYVLYAAAPITLLALVYLFLIRPCMVRSKAREEEIAAGGMLAGGGGMLMMPGGLNSMGMMGKKGKKKSKGDPQSGDVHVNLIVDPRMFQHQQPEEEEEDDELDEPGDDLASSVPGSYTPLRRPRPKKKPRRRGFMEGLALERAWIRARANHKVQMWSCILGMILWGAVFVLVLMGKRCPSGAFMGW